MTHDLMYIPENEVKIVEEKIHPYKTIQIPGKVHRFLQQYAWEYAKIEVPYPKGESIFLRERHCQKIAKAMLTHQTSPEWDDENPFIPIGRVKQQDTRRYIIETPNVNAGEIQIEKTWQLQKVFREGGSSEIIGFQGVLEGHAYPGDYTRRLQINVQMDNFQHMGIHIPTGTSVDDLRQKAYQSFRRQP